MARANANGGGVRRHPSQGKAPASPGKGSPHTEHPGASPTGRAAQHGAQKGRWAASSERVAQTGQTAGKTRSSTGSSQRARAMRGAPGRREPGSAGGGLVLALEAPLTVDAVAREGERVETLLADGLAAPLALAEAPL